MRRIRGSRPSSGVTGRYGTRLSKSDRAEVGARVLTCGADACRRHGDRVMCQAVVTPPGSVCARCGCVALVGVWVHV